MDSATALLRSIASDQIRGSLGNNSLPSWKDPSLAWAGSKLLPLGHLDFHVGRELPGVPVYRIAAAAKQDGEVLLSLLYTTGAETTLPAWRRSTCFSDSTSYNRALVQMTQTRTLAAASPARQVLLALCNLLPGASHANPPYPVFRPTAQRRAPWALPA